MSKGEIKMMKRLSLITVGFMLILFVTGAHAAYLVDTGEDPGHDASFGIYTVAGGGICLG